MNIPSNHLKAILLFAAKGDTRYYINSVMFDPQPDGSTIMVATNGHYLAAIKLDQSAGQIADRQVIIDRGVIEKALKVCGDGIEITAHTIANLPYTQVDGKYPDWRNIVPKKTNGGTAQFNPLYLATFSKASKLMGGEIPSVAYNGTGAAIIGIGNDDFLGVIMPCRILSPTMPDWAK